MIILKSDHFEKRNIFDKYIGWLLFTTVKIAKNARFFKNHQFMTKIAERSRKMGILQKSLIFDEKHQQIAKNGILKNHQLLKKIAGNFLKLSGANQP